MFSQKKKKSRMWVAAIPFVFLFIFGLWLNADDDDVSEDSIRSDVSEKAVSEKDADYGTEIPIFEYNENDSAEKEEKEIDEDNNDDEKLNDTGDADMNGYLVKTQDDKVHVYSYDNGKLTSALETEINPEMLPEYDRKCLSEGMYVETENEVYDLLQNFEG